MTDMSPATVRAGLKFLADRASTPVYVASRGGGDQTEHLGNFHTQDVSIHDARAGLPSSDLDREGFMLRPHRSAVRDFYDDRTLPASYHPELKALVKDVTGARRVEIFDDTRRSSSLEKQRAHSIREPANVVHNDYTTRSGPQRLADYCAAAQEEARPERFAIVNVWRSIAAPVIDQPLALCDATTVRDDDLVAAERRGENRLGEIQLALYHPDQRWYFYPNMNRDEVLLFKTFDSALDGRTRFTLHSAFVHPQPPDGAARRESIESRCLLFF